MAAMFRGVLAVAILGAAFGLANVPVASGQGKKGAEAKAAVFEVYLDKGGKYRFRLTSGEELLAMAAHGYDNRQDCLKAVEAIRRLAPKATIEEKTKDKAK